MKQKLTIANLALFVCYLIAFALSIKCFREPDLWWQIRTGQWILEHGAVPVTDPFSYTFFGKPWINIKWGFEVLAALVSNTLGAESVYLIQAVCSCALVFFLVRLARVFNAEAKPSGWIVALALMITLFGIEYRIIGRPEMSSHLLTVVFMLLLLSYRKVDSRWIWLLLPLQMVWANVHEAFGLGVVLVALFTVGTWVEFAVARQQELKTKAVKLSIVLVLLPLAILINPRGYKLLLQPLEIFGQVQENKYTTELVSFTDYEFWHKEAYLAIVVLVVAIVAIGLQLWQLRKAKKPLGVVFREFPAGYVLVILALAYLASTAYRNIVFLLLVLFPVLVYALQIAGQKMEKQAKKAEVAVLIVGLVLYGLVVTDKYYELVESRDHFGLQVLSSNNPVGAADYISGHKLQGRCFSDYLSSSYLLWKLQPEFRTFIDLRDLDVFPADFFQLFAEAMVMPEGFAKVDSAYKFSYITLLNRPDFAAAHQIMRQGGKYKEVFADQVASVYIQGNDTAVKDVYAATKSPVSSATASIVNHVLNPMYKPVAGEAYEADYFAAAHYLEMGEYAIAMDRAQKAASYKTKEGFEILGRVYITMAGSMPSDSIRIAYTNNAFNAYIASNNAGQNAAANNGLGSILFRQNNIMGATEYFEKALALNPGNTNTLMNVAECYKARINEPGAAEKVIEMYRKVNRINPDNPNIMLQLGAAYTRKGDCSSAREILLKVDGFQGFSPEQQKVVSDCLRQCPN